MTVLCNLISSLPESVENLKKCFYGAECVLSSAIEDRQVPGLIITLLPCESPQFTPVIFSKISVLFAKFPGITVQNDFYLRADKAVV